MDLTTAIANARRADADLVAAMHAEYKAGTTGANEIARQVRAAGLRGYSRSIVLELLGAETLREKAERILRDAGWDISIPGMAGDARIYLGTKREVMVTLTGEEEPDSVAALNAASALCTALHQGGLGTWAAGHLHAYEALGRGETIEITDAEN